MQIQLKQNEIIAGVKQYLAMQGINLVNRTVSVSFTAGRKETGLTADVCIEGDTLDLIRPIQNPVLVPRQPLVNSILRGEDVRFFQEPTLAPTVNDPSEVIIAESVYRIESEVDDVLPEATEPEAEVTTPTPVVTPVKSLFG